MSGRRARILFVLLHSGYLRHYAEPIAELARRGHQVHVASARSDEKHVGDDLLLQNLLERYPTVTASVAPMRPYEDGWRRLAFFVRALIDVARYADPDYANADALRDRIIGSTTQRIDMTRLPTFMKTGFRRRVSHFARSASREKAASRIRRLQRIEDAIPPNGEITAFVASHEPDLVIASPVVEFASVQVEYLKSARALGVRTGVCIASWDNLTNKGLIRFVPNRVFVWNDIQRREAERYNGIPPTRSVATGAPRFDPWFERKPSIGRAAFVQGLGLDPSRPYLLYLCSSPFIAPDEVSFVRRWLHAIRTAAEPHVRNVGVLIRPHPQNADQWATVDLDDDHAAIWPKGGVHPDDGDAQEGYFHSMEFSAAVVGINTSALIEAGIVGRSVYTLLDPAFAGTQDGTLHFQYLRAENGGFVHTAAQFDEHLDQLSRGLAGSAGDREATLAFVRSFVRPRGLERPAAGVLADELERLALATEPSADERVPGARATRVALSPLSAAMALAARVLR